MKKITIPTVSKGSESGPKSTVLGYPTSSSEGSQKKEAIMAVHFKRGRRYFVAGAMWSGCNDQYDRFVKLGIWESGWDPQHDEYAPIISQVQEGDRIAIKKGLGPGTSETVIRAIGIVKGVDVTRGLIYVEWVLTGMKRKVHSRGCYKTIHGPYRKTDEDLDLANWLSRIFSI